MLAQLVNTEHPQTFIEHRAFAAEVDADIAPLILEMWRAGIPTILSCQDNGREGARGRIWISLPAGAAESFLTIAAGEYSEEIDSLYNRVVGGFEPESWKNIREHHAWHYGSTPIDVSLDIDSHAYVTSTGPTEVMVAADVRFPRGDLDEVLKRMRAHNELRRHEQRS